MTGMSWNYAPIPIQSSLYQNIIHFLLNITLCLQFHIIVESR
jgi:hypothetical protein